MEIAVRILVALSMVWAAAAFVWQVLAARGGGRRDFSERTGSPWRGVFYSFTGAMLPWHKETIRGYPAQFVAGIVMHAGVMLCLAAVVLLTASPELGTRALAASRPVLPFSVGASIYLLARRAVSPTLRVLSVPDDYVAILATMGLLALGINATAFAVGPTVFLVYAAVLFIYLPLGKLRHAVFFFLARGDLGRRLGYRGVYPPAGGG